MQSQLTRLLGGISIFVALTGCSSLPLASTPETKVTPVHLQVADGKIEVDAGNSTTYRIDVTPEMLDPTITGSFTASGGSGNDVEVALGDDINITNWTNGHQASLLWNTPGQLTTGKFEVKVKPGSYFLAISNKFSLLTSKNVTLTASLDYGRNDPVR